MAWRQAPFRQTSLILGIATLWYGCLVAIAAEARPWTSVDGKVVEAEFVEFANNGKSVVLDVDGRRFTVALNRLSAADQAHAAELAEQQGMDTGPSERVIDGDLAPANAEENSGEASNEVGYNELNDRRTWTDRAGRSVNARFIRFVQGTVLLREGARYHRISFYDLSLADRQFMAACYAAMGKEHLLPPIRPELADEGGHETDSSDTEATPTEAESSPAPEDSAPASLAANERDVVLPPSGFGSEATDAAAESSNRGSMGDASSPSQLPPSGFGSLPDEASADEAVFPANTLEEDVHLPATGFGSSGEAETQTDIEFFGRPAEPEARKHVKIPQSTIVDRDSEQLPRSNVEADEQWASADIGFGRPRATSTESTSFGGIAPEEAATGTSSSPAPKSGQASKRARPTPRAQTPQHAMQPLMAQPAQQLTTVGWNRRAFGSLLVVVGSLCFASSYFYLVAQAFLESLQTGVRSTIPGFVVYWGISELENASVPVLTLLFGACLVLGGCAMLLG